MEARQSVAVVPLALLSAVVLALEVLHTRIVSYSVQVILLYAVLGIAMLGFGAAGSLVAVRRTWVEPERTGRVLAWAALAFALSTVLAHAAFVRLTPLLEEVDAMALAVAGLLTLPFLAAGTVITLALSTAGEGIGRAYAANLIGSGAGCFIPLALLGPLDGEHMLGLLSVLSWCCALLYVRRAGASPRSGLGYATGAVLVVSVVSLAAAHRVFPIQPEPPPLGQLAGQYLYAKQNGIEVIERYDRWNPTGRIQIVEFNHVPGGPDPYPAMFYAQDSTAGSSLLRWDGRTRDQVAPDADQPGSFVSRLCSETIYGQGYFRQRSKVLIIGLGGGPDLQCAIYEQTGSVDVVEINPDSIAAIQGPLDSWVGGIGHHPNAHFYARDGRSFIHGAENRDYDLIQLTGVDTKHHLASGGLALSENHLYTLEAFEEYLDSLSETGVLSIIRFGEPEALRLLNTAWSALVARGVEHPERHFAVHNTGIAYGLLVGRNPLSDADIATLRARLAPPYFRGVEIYYYRLNGVPLSKPASPVYPSVTETPVPLTELVAMATEGKRQAFVDKFVFDISPTTDDRPFFFDILRYDYPETWRAPHVVALRNVLLSVLLLSVILIVLPVFRLREPLHGAHAFTTPVFFASVGLAYVLLEIWLLHTFAMYLGHQVYSLSVVLSSLLVATGIGAHLSSRYVPDPRRRVVTGAAGIVILYVLGSLTLPAITEATWDAALAVRAAVAVAFVAPAGIAMGFPFVGGLTWLRSKYPGSVPWCIGINAFSSVLASVSAIPLSMWHGYTAILTVGALLYVVAGLIGATMRTSREAGVERA